MTCRELQVREAAYFLWEIAGKPESSALKFWCEAERSVILETNPGGFSSLNIGLPRDEQDPDCMT
jgi:hypothetical protein